ncbi:hypothetical protein AB0E01_05960 [Nocardia vinacea]|uniref:hypothetical protein n=1 Tax=Nocardia vinacea TaxID=96468 RepID=UPI0033E3DD4C
MRPGRAAGTDRTRRTESEGLQAIWRLDGHRATIIRVHGTSGEETVVSFDPGPYPDLAEARERFPRLTELWDAVRHEYWAELAAPHQFPRGRRVT